MSSFRFIHAADIHLDSALKGLAGLEGPATERIHSATREAFERLISEAIEEQVSFVVIAGDLYDGDWRDYQTGLLFVRQVGRLAGVKIPLLGPRSCPPGLRPARAAPLRFFWQSSRQAYP